jgi:hypothetical protein
LFSAVAAPLAAQNVKAGIEAWQHADYAAAVAIWRPLAEKGDAEAQFNLAQAYRFGRGVPINLAAAQVWYERAARKGHEIAQWMLGDMLFENGRKAAGLRWLKMAADKEEPHAMLLYGLRLFNGDGVKRDPVLGYAYVSRAAAQGLAPAKDSLAQLDQMLPLDARQKGGALAAAKPKVAQPASSKPVQPAKPIQTAAAKPAPKAAHVPPAAAPQYAASAAWRIQLGAFSQRSSAEALYRKVSGSLGGHQAFYIPVGAMTRLQVGPYPSRAAAQSACSALKGQPCFPVAAAK